jgi:hypothetical protein
MNEPSFTSQNLDPELDKDSYDVGIKASPIGIVKRKLKQAFLEGGEDGLISKALFLVTCENISRDLVEMAILGLNINVRIAADCYASFAQTLDNVEIAKIEVTEVAERVRRNVDG